jgi:threonine dehydratase
MEGKLLAEPSSCIGIGLGAVLRGRLPADLGMRVCFLLSGGNAGLSQLDLLK